MKLGTYFNKRNLLRVLREIPNVVATIIVVGIMVATTVFVVSLYYDYPIAKINPAPEKPTIPIPLSYPPIPGIHLPGTFLYSSMILKANSTIAEGVEVWPTSGYAQQISG